MIKPSNTRYLLLLAMILLPAVIIAQKRDSVMFGVASYYHPKFNGRKTSNGEIFRNDSLTAAHKYLPFGTRVRVTNLNNDSSVIVRINDRLPQGSKRSIDLSQAAARRLDMMRAGIVKARIEILPYDVMKVSPQFAAYLLNEKGIKITPGVTKQLKSGGWRLSYITDTLNGKVTHTPVSNSALLLHYGDSAYVTSQRSYGNTGKWNIIDSLLIIHQEVKKESPNPRNVNVEFNGPYLIYKLDSSSLVIGKPLSSDKKWHRNYHFQKEPIEMEFQKLVEEQKAMNAKYDRLHVQLEAELAAAYEKELNETYKSYPLGITREPQKKVGGYLVDTIIYKQTDKTTVYTRKEYDWGGVFYFKNDVSITQNIFEKETGIK